MFAYYLLKKQITLYKSILYCWSWSWWCKKSGKWIMLQKPVCRGIGKQNEYKEKEIDTLP